MGWALTLVAAGPSIADTEAPSYVIRVQALPDQPFLSLEATIGLPGTHNLELHLRTDFDLLEVHDEMAGKAVGFERHGTQVRLSAAESSRLRFVYRWPLSQPLDQLGGLVAWQPWYPTLGRGSEIVPASATIIAELQGSLTAISSGKLTVTSLAGGARRFRWRQAQPQRLLPIILGDFVWDRTSPAAALHAFLPRELAPRLGELSALATSAMGFLSAKFGTLDTASYTVVGVPLAPGQRGLTVPGLSVFSTSGIKLSEPLPERIIAHELSHNWWSLGVAFPALGDAWLREGLPTYSAILFLESHFGDARLREELANSKRLARSVTDPEPLAVGDAMQHPRAAYTQNYHKAAYVLHMLRRQIGRQALTHLLRQWFEQARGTSGTTAEFEKRVSKVSPDSLQPFFEFWVRKARLPKYSIRYRVRGTTLQGTIRQSGADLRHPVTLRLHHHQEATDHVVNLDGRRTRFAIHGIEGLSSLEFDPDADLLHGGVSINHVGGSEK